MSETPDLWARFTHDPRDPAHASLRAADVDREVVHQVLTEAYADGRLDREEFDARTTEVTGARTLGDLLPPLEGLVPAAGVPTLRTPAEPVLGPVELHERAVASWRGTIRAEIARFLTASLICWTIWLLTGTPFPWPVFVSLGTAVPVLNSLLQRTEIIESRRSRLEKKQRKELEARTPEPSGPEEGDA